MGSNPTLSAIPECGAFFTMEFEVPLHFFHYGEQEHIDRFFDDGSMQIGTVFAYDTETHGPMIGDDGEGTSTEAIHDKNVDKFVSAGNTLPTLWGLPIFKSPGCSGNVVIRQNVSFNYAIFCMTNILHGKLCKDFSENYSSAIFIERPFPFFHEVTKALTDSFDFPSVIFQHVSDIRYQSRNIEPGTEIIEALTKSEQYRHQSEVRALWNVGEPKQKFIRFKAPNAVRCCRKITFENMPIYDQNDSQEIMFDQIRMALASSTSR